MKVELKVSDTERNQVKELVEKARRTKTNLAYFDNVIIPKIQDYDFRAPVNVSGSVSSYGIDVNIKVASTNPTDQESYLAVADAVHIFGYKLDRTFNEYNGTFYWSGRNYGVSAAVPEGEIQITVYVNNISTGKCEIVKVKKEVTEIREVYEAHCNE
jgi:hypothetical protein